MKKFVLLSVILLSLISLSGCSDKFKYFGNTYAPTTYAKIYFQEADIDKPYEVMGKMYCTFKTNAKDEKVQNKIMAAVQKHGGDGAVFGEMGAHLKGTVTTGGGGATAVGKKKNSSVGAGVSKTKELEEDEMEIIVIKFKQVANP